MAWTSGTASGLPRPADSPQGFHHRADAAGQRALASHALGTRAAGRTGLEGVGLAGTDEIYVAIQTETSSDYGNWKLRGYVFPDPGVAFDAQYNSSQTFYALLTLSAMPYWFVANGRRIVVVVSFRTVCASRPVSAVCHTGSIPVSPCGGWLIQRLDAGATPTPIVTICRARRLFRGVLVAHGHMEQQSIFLAGHLGQQSARSGW